ncbi:MAG: hypothetical protein QOC80_2589 [Frankiaceae bacterium]|nr:hypothetical protein [Frankiaceae bacterium]
MTRTPNLRRRRRGRARLLLLAAAGLGAAAGAAGWVVSRSSGSTSAAERPKPAPAPETTDSTPPSTDSDDAPVQEQGQEQEAPSRGVRSDRLVLEDEWGAGPLDGAWWPDSEDAVRAVPGLVEALPDTVGLVSRLALPMSDWSDDQPKTLQLEDRTIHLAWFAGMQRHTARITFESGDAVTVLVLPPDTEAGTASNVLSQAAEQRSREDLLAEAGLED